MAYQEIKNFSFTHSIAVQWRKAFKKKRFVLYFSITLCYLVALTWFMSYFLPFINLRKGTQLRNLWIEYLPAFDLSIAIFSVIYISLLLTLLYTLNKPTVLLRLLVTLAIMYSLHCLTIYLVPLEPPLGYIPLTDPVIKWLANNGKIITKDLFFSGYTGFLFTCILVVRKKYLEIGLCMALVAVVIMLIFQHAHYFIDIGGAFVITPFCWVISGKILPFSYPLASAQKKTGL